MGSLEGVLTLHVYHAHTVATFNGKKTGELSQKHTEHRKGAVASINLSGDRLFDAC